MNASLTTALLAALLLAHGAFSQAPQPGPDPSHLQASTTGAVPQTDGANPDAVPHPPGDPGETQNVPVPPDSTVVFHLQAGSRLYPEWKEDHKVRVGERFYLGDTPSSAEVRRFFPAFLIVDRKPINTSLEMVNPAVQVLVYEGDTVTDSTWAFLNFPPHYSARSFFTFQLKQVQGYGKGGS